MHTLYRILPLLLSVLLLTACQDDDNGAGMSATISSVTTDETSALQARVNVTLTMPGDVVVYYWPAGDKGNTHTAQSTVRRGHSIPLLGLQANTAYEFRIIPGGDESAAKDGNFTTPSIPPHVTDFYQESESTVSPAASGYYLFASMTKPGCLYLVDGSGSIVWYRTTPNVIKAARIAQNNTIITLEDNTDNAMGDGNIILQTTFANDTVFYQVSGRNGFDRIAHHDVQVAANGDVVMITNEMKDGYPGDGLLVLDYRGNKKWRWSTFDAMPHINPENYRQPWGNSLFIDTDGHYIVSFRSLCQVWKIHNTTGAVLWTLGKNGTIALPEGGEFLYQHYAHRNADGDIMLFDNGDASRPTSRAVAFKLNELQTEATLTLDTPLPSALYSNIMGSALLLPDKNILAASAVNGRLVQLTQAGDVHWQLKTASRVYRVEHVAKPW